VILRLSRFRNDREVLLGYHFFLRSVVCFARFCFTRSLVMRLIKP
jgi:hypothetical protein